MSPVERLERIVGIIDRARADAKLVDRSAPPASMIPEAWWWTCMRREEAAELERLARGHERRRTVRRRPT